MNLEYRFTTIQKRGPRPEQQDRTLAFGPSGVRQLALAAVFDGAGGTRAGGRAADVAAASLAASFFGEADSEAPGLSGEALVRRWLGRASWSVSLLRADVAAENVPKDELPAATAALALLEPDGRLTVGWSGDSPVALLPARQTAGRPQPLTSPHNAWEDPVWRKRFPNGGGDHITRWLGRLDPELRAEVRTGMLQPEERILLATDGFWDLVCGRTDWSRPEEALNDVREKDLSDNASAVLVCSSARTEER